MDSDGLHSRLIKERKSEEVSIGAPERVSRNDFGTDFFTGGKMIKLNEVLSEDDGHGEGIEIVFSRDGRLALLETSK